MPSSTFSSSELPRPGRLRWGTALVVALSVLSALELGWRRLGHVPIVDDTPELWSSERLRVGADPRVVVLVGSSRCQAGIAPEELSEALGDRPVVQLSISGGTGLPVLEDLAADASFRGTVLCEVISSTLFAAGDNGPTAAAIVRAHRERTLVAPLEARLRSRMRTHIVFMQSHLHPKNVGRELLRVGALPRVVPMRTTATRELRVHFALGDLGLGRHHWTLQNRDRLAQRLGGEAREALVAHIGELVDRIRERGGEVVFLRLPTSDYVREFEDAEFPRREFWDRLVLRTGKGLSFEDVPELSTYECPDGSHLDVGDVPEFTRLIGRALALRFLTPGA